MPGQIALSSCIGRKRRNVRTGQNNPILPTMMNLKQRKKMVKELLATTVDLQNPIYTLLNKFTYVKR